MLIINILIGFKTLIQYYKSVKCGPKTEMCSNFHEIWHLVQIKNANYEYSAWNWRYWPKIIDQANLAPRLKSTPTFMKFGTQDTSDILIINPVCWMDEQDPKKGILENFVPNLKCAQCLWILTLKTNRIY